MKPVPPRAVVTSTGCKLNQAEADLWRVWLTKRGYHVVNGDEASDGASGDSACTGVSAPVEVCVITTCTVTEAADRSSIAQVRRLHRKYPGAQIKVTGCGVENIPHRFLDITGVSELVSYRRKEHEIGELGYGDMTGSLPVSRNRAFLRVGDGCNRHCAYCIVSLVRGPLNSRPAETIVEELKVLAGQGFGEAVLVALNLGLWGRDRRTNLADLIHEINRHAKDVPRVRLTSLEPDTINDDLLDAIEEGVGGVTGVCPHFHIPLQSGDDKVLKAMGRPYDTGEFSGLVEGIRARFPDACIGTDVICSTPPEDEASFEKTLRFVEQLPIDHLHAFTYSPRPGTPMAKLPRAVGPRERTKRLRKTGATKNLAFRKRFVGKERPAVILAPNRVLTDNYIDVRIKETSRPLRLLTLVRITRAGADETIGEIV